MKKNRKSEKEKKRTFIIKYMEDYPTATDLQIANVVGCTRSYVWMLRRQQQPLKILPIRNAKKVFHKHVDAMHIKREEENSKQFGRSELLQSANELVSSTRANEHGEAIHNFICISELWNAYLGLGKTITPQDVPLMLSLLKIARIKENPDNADNYRDICGYSALAGEVSRKK